MSSLKTHTKTVQVKSIQNAWMITFGDLIMLLLAFFVMLLAMKSMDTKDLKNLFRSVSREKGPLEYTESEIAGKMKDILGDNLKAIFIENREMLKNLLELIKDTQTAYMEERKEKEIFKIFQIDETMQGMVLSLSAEELFEPGKSEIKPQKLYILDAAASLLRKTSNDILIMGYNNSASSQPDEFVPNWEIPFYRSLNIYYYLSDTNDLKPNRFAVGGYGKYPGNGKKSSRIEFIFRNAIDY